MKVMDFKKLIYYSVYLVGRKGRITLILLNLKKEDIPIAHQMTER